MGRQHIALHEIRVAEHWQRWAMFGSLGIVLGVAATAIPLQSPTSVASVGLALALLLFFDSIFQALHAFHIRLHPGAGWRLTAAAVSLGAAALLLLLPEAIPLGLAISVFLLHSGLARCFMATSLEPLAGWPWLLAAGALGLISGGLLLLLGPADSGPLHCIPVALLLIFDGFWLWLTACTARRRWPPERRMARLV